MRSLRKWLQVTAVALFLTATGCGASLTKDIQLESVASEKVDFAGLKTYAWFGGLGLVRDTTGTWSPKGLDVTAELKFLIDRELRERGYTETTDRPDFYVGFLVAANVDQLSAVEKRGGKVGALGSGEGALIVELIDAASEQTIWVGVATAEVETERSADETRKRLEYGVEELIGRVPR